jgi:hypothetical protein
MQTFASNPRTQEHISPSFFRSSRGNQRFFKPSIEERFFAPNPTARSQATSKAAVQNDFRPTNSKVIQTKRTLDVTGNLSEQKADYATDPVMRLPKPQLQHKCACGGKPGPTTHPLEESGKTQANNLYTPSVSKPAHLQRQAKGGPPSSKTDVCPPMERNEKEEAAKSQLQLVERIPRQEWLIYGFPIGGTDVPAYEAGRFIATIVKSLMQGQFVYMIGQDPLVVLGYSDCFAGPKVDNRAIRQARAAQFCDGVRAYYASTPKSYAALIRSCAPAPMDQWVGSNATPANRAQNRSILVRRVAATAVHFEEGSQSYPHNPKYGPSAEHCAAYNSPHARSILERTYINNAHCSCMVTPDEPHNNCVRACLQDKMWNLLASESSRRKPKDPPMDITQACILIWKHHRECYHDCGCESEFIDYLAFNAVCNTPLPCAVDSAAINLTNRCMPAKKNDKYHPVN